MAKWSSSVAGPSSGLRRLSAATSGKTRARRARDDARVAERLEVDPLGALDLHVAAEPAPGADRVEADRRDADAARRPRRPRDRAAAAAPCTTARRRSARGRPCRRAAPPSNALPVTSRSWRVRRRRSTKEWSKQQKSKNDSSRARSTRASLAQLALKRAATSSAVGVSGVPSGSVPASRAAMRSSISASDTFCRASSASKSMAGSKRWPKPSMLVA